MDQLVKLERVDLLAIQLAEPVPNMIQKQTQLFFVVAADQLPRSPPPCFLTLDLSDPGHRLKLPPINTLAKCRF